MDELSSQQAVKEAQLSNLHEWQRISPIAILYFVGSIIKHLVNNALVLIAPLAFTYEKLIQHQLYVWLGLSTLVVLLFLYAGLAYYFYLFRISDDTVEIKAGVFAKKHLNLPFSRIQNISIEQPFYYRMTDFSCLQLDTAGSAKQEAKIIAVPLQLGNSLKHFILQHKEFELPQQETPAADNNEQLLNKRSLSDLIVHGITNNRVWIILGITAPFYDSGAKVISDYLLSLGIDINAMFSDQSIAWWQLGLYALSATMMIMMVVVLLSIAGSILMFYGYTLSKSKDRYIRRSGLITHQEVSMKLSRLQLVIRKQDWLDVLLGRINLVFKQNSAFEHAQQALNNVNSLIVPSIKDLECRILTDDALIGNRLMQVDFHAISKRFILRNAVFFWLPLCALLFFATVYNQLVTEAVIIINAYALIVGLVCLRWKRWGYAFDNNYIYIRKGLLGVDYYCFPIFKVQQTKLHQSIFMKKRKMATLGLVLASGGLTIPYIREDSCRHIVDFSLFTVESEPRSWM